MTRNPPLAKSDAKTTAADKMRQMLFAHHPAISSKPRAVALTSFNKPLAA